MIPNPIRRVLSSIERRQVRALLMGGQACVLYGAAEFSRDTDLAILASTANLERLQHALDDLRAQVIAVPPFDAKYLRRGHAVHFRCQEGEAAGMRVDARPGRELRLTEGLLREERAERQADARYWRPLKVELARLRHERPSGTPSSGREGR